MPTYPYTIVWFNFNPHRRKGRKWVLDTVSSCCDNQADDDCSIGTEHRIGNLRAWLWSDSTPRQLRLTVPTSLLEGEEVGAPLSPFELLFGRRPQ